jgi:hypothetical protein
MPMFLTQPQDSPNIYRVNNMTRCFTDQFCTSVDSSNSFSAPTPAKHCVYQPSFATPNISFQTCALPERMIRVNNVSLPTSLLGLTP